MSYKADTFLFPSVIVITEQCIESHQNAWTALTELPVLQIWVHHTHNILCRQKYYYQKAIWSFYIEFDLYIEYVLWKLLYLDTYMIMLVFPVFAFLSFHC
jgi:hypothetical protein